MSAREKRLISAAKYGLAVIGELANGAAAVSPLVGVPGAAPVLAVIGTIVGTIEKGFERELTPAEVLEGIEKAVKSLDEIPKAGDAAIDKEADEKFGKKPASPPPGYKMKTEPGAVVPPDSSETP